ncbi:MAG: anaerobic sulfatase maturase [Anaerolineales bacterium]
MTDSSSMQTKENLDLILPQDAPPAFHLLAKPTGAICNLDCAYCFFLDKELLYPGSKFRMSDELLESYIRQLIVSHQTDRVTIAWQGGEPTLMGLDFYRRAMRIAEKYRRPGMTFEHTMQTNGTKLDDEWCAFFKEHNFLIGISIDGPRHLHDVYRVDKGGQPTFDKVMRGLRLLQKHAVDYNILTTVNRINGDHPLEVYRFLRDEAGTDWMQFIPVVERINEDGLTLIQQGTTVSDRSVLPEQFGNFLSVIFDEWVHHDVGRIYVQTFEAAVRNWLGMPSSGMCVFNETCGLGVALEHNGDLYACDHFVEPDYLLGNIQQEHMIELMVSPQQKKFGQDKRDTLPQYCLDCDVRFACHGECPKNRFIETPDGEPGLNYLCAGFKHFFHHVDYPMKIIAGLIRRGRPAAEVMDILAQEQTRWATLFAQTGRKDPCPCGSGRKFKQCHGQRSQGSFRIPHRPAPRP